MNVLIIHQNFPAQFRHLALHLAKMEGTQLIAIGKKGCPGLESIKTILYDLHRGPASQVHHYVRPLESGVLYGQAVARVLLSLRDSGFVPDVVVAHPGWGEALFVKDVYPRTKLISLFEFFYHAEGADTNFDPAFPITFDDRARIRSKNALHFLNLDACDVGITPTRWQKSVHPQVYHSKIRTIHEGIDTGLLKPNAKAVFSLPNGNVLSSESEVITYVARNLEPYRGFPTFMQVVDLLCKQRPNCTIVIVGGDDVSYGSVPKDAKNWREKLLKEISFDANRVHFLGRIPYDNYRALLQVSTVHVYLTYPFVLSWSMLEAMSSGCLVVGSSTAPVCEVIEHEKNGLLANFFDAQDIVRKIEQAMEQEEPMKRLRINARKTIQQRYSLDAGLRGYLSVMEELLR